LEARRKCGVNPFSLSVSLRLLGRRVLKTIKAAFESKIQVLEFYLRSIDFAEHVYSWLSSLQSLIPSSFLLSILTQIVKAMHRILDVLESRGLLLESSEELDDASATVQPVDDGARVVRELLDTERKYVQDLEVMQVSFRVFHMGL